MDLFFYFFATLAIASAGMVVLSRNTVRSVLYLIFSFFCTAGIWMLLQSEFLAIVLVLVYVGAVMVLFLFVVMMLDIEAPAISGSFVRYWPIALLIAGGLLAATLRIVGPPHFDTSLLSLSSTMAGYSHVKELGRLLYSHFLLPFEIAGVLLLVAMVAAIALTFRGRQGARYQRAEAQIRVSKADRLRIVTVPTERGDNA